MTVTHLSGGTIRKQWFTEKDKLRDHLLRLDPESRRMRFGMSVGDKFIRQYAEQTSQFQSVVYGYFVGREMRAAAELRMIGTSWRGEAEAAFSVERRYQDSGVGTELLGKTIVASRNRGIERLYMNCLSENRRMQSIARKFEAELYFDHGDVVGKLAPAYPTPLSLWSEAVDNSNGFVMAVLEARLQQFKPAA
ncbi:MAG: GNAT family N-acetyltransferase [Hyphomicrobiales bacterium]|nr:GNAT family N-acetyltransferase [Hyphomicrobiales bacterium]